MFQDNSKPQGDLMRNILLASTLLLLSSCVNFKGTFNSYKTLKFVHSTVFGNSKTKTVPAGTYATKFKFTSEDKMKLTFEREGDDIEVKIKLPTDRSFPRERGAINLPASVTGQRYDIKGFIDTRYSQSGMTRSSESCTYTVYQRSCSTSCDSRGNCRQICERIPVNRYGRQDVEFRYKYTDRDLKLELVAPGNESIVGDYRGEDRDVEKVYTYQGRCF